MRPAKRVHPWSCARFSAKLPYSVLSLANDCKVYRPFAVFAACSLQPLATEIAQSPWWLHVILSYTFSPLWKVCSSMDNTLSGSSSTPALGLKDICLMLAMQGCVIHSTSRIRP